MLKTRHLKSHHGGFSLSRHLRVLAALGFTRKVHLRPYQENCINICLSYLKAGRTRIGVSLPTGSGKTTVFLSLLTCLPALQPSGSRSLIIVNSIELASQTAAQARILCPGKSVEMEQGAKHQATGLADITVATYQTLQRHERLSKFEPSTINAVIVDEAHHAAAASYRRILSHFDRNIPYKNEETQAFSCLRGKSQSRIPIIGFSATFSRHDGLALGDVFEEIVYHRDFIDMIKEQWLCDIKFTTVKANIDLSKVSLNRVTGDFNATSLARVVDTQTFNSLVVDSWLDRAISRKSTLVFCSDLSHVRNLTSGFRRAGIDARYLYARTSPGDRQQLLAEFRAGTYPVLINCSVLTEGADIPNIDCLVIARPTKSRNVFAQMLGRGMRLSPVSGKADCHVIDFVESSTRVHGVMSTPTLLGVSQDSMEEQNENLMSGSVAAMTQHRESAPIQQDDLLHLEVPRTITYEDYDDPFSLFDGGSGAPHVHQLSPFAWVGCGDEVYVLESFKRGFLRICRSVDNSALFEAHFVANFENETKFYRRKRKVLSADNLTAAIRGCDTYMKRILGHAGAVAQLSRTAAWRGLPASEAQRSFISKRYRNSKNATFNVSALTKGQAASMIARLKHGAQARLDKTVRAAARWNDRERDRLEKIERQVVKVGPLPPSNAGG